MQPILDIKAADPVKVKSDDSHANRRGGHSDKAQESFRNTFAREEKQQAGKSSHQRDHKSQATASAENTKAEQKAEASARPQGSDSVGESSQKIKTEQATAETVKAEDTCTVLQGTELRVHPLKGNVNSELKPLGLAAQKAVKAVDDEVELIVTSPLVAGVVPLQPQMGAVVDESALNPQTEDPTISFSARGLTLRESLRASDPKGGLAVLSDGVKPVAADTILSPEGIAKAPGAVTSELSPKGAAINPIVDQVSQNLIRGEQSMSVKSDAVFEELFHADKVVAENRNAAAAVATPNALPTPQDQSISRMQMPVSISFGKPQWAGMVAERAAMMAGQAIQSAELQLDPPELGPLQVRVHVQNDQVSVSFVSSHANVREALDLSASRLRELCDQQGMTLVDVDVSDHSAQQQQAEADQNQSAEAAVAGTSLTEGDGELKTVQLSVSSGIDYYA